MILFNLVLYNPLCIKRNRVKINHVHNLQNKEGKGYNTTRHSKYTLLNYYYQHYIIVVAVGERFHTHTCTFSFEISGEQPAAMQHGGATATITGITACCTTTFGRLIQWRRGPQMLVLLLLLLMSGRSLEGVGLILLLLR